MLRQPALTAIGGYQRFLSPRKGYGCAYRLAYGGAGCWGFTKHAIADNGLLRALPSILRRFHDCQQAATALHSDTQNDETPNQPEKKTRWYDYCDPCSAGCYCARGKGRGADISPDCTPDCSPDCCSL